jgi:hypothetical protein
MRAVLIKWFVLSMVCSFNFDAFNLRGKSEGQLIAFYERSAKLLSLTLEFTEKTEAQHPPTNQ